MNYEQTLPNVENEIYWNRISLLVFSGMSLCLSWKMRITNFILDTFGGIGIWAIIDLFLIPSKVNAHNLIIANQIDSIEKREREESHARNMAMLNAVANSNKNPEQSITE